MPVRRSGAAALVAVCALALPGRTRAQAESLGSPVLTNYDPGQYKAHAQNWVAVQDRRGVLYFGNSVGILEFDGRRWQLIPTRDGAIVRALTIGPDGTVYYGSVGDIGYLTASPEGKVTSVSLRDAIPEADRTFNDVWQALSTSRGIYFLTRERVFRFADGEVRPIPARITSSQACVLDDDLFLVDPERGICLVRGDEVVPVPALAGLVGGRRLVLAPFGPRQLLVARSAGDVSRVDLGPFWVEATRSYDFSRPVPEGVVTRVPTELDEILPETEAFLYKLYPLDGETFAVCTIRAGVFVIDRSGKVVRVVNTQRGLIDNTVSGVFVDRAGDLWVTSNSGITHVALSSPQSWFGARDGIQGVSISVARSRGRFFVGTYQNVFVQRPYRFGGKDDRQVFEPLENGPSEVWQFVERGGDLLVASGQGVFRIVGEKAVLVPEARRAAYSLGVTRRFPDHLFVGLIGGLSLIRRTARGWQAAGRVEGVDDNVRALVEDDDGDLWAATDAKGLLRIRFTGDDPASPVVERFGPEQGLPGLNALLPLYRDSVLYVATPNGLYRADLPPGLKAPRRPRFAPDEVLGRALPDPKVAILSMACDGRGRFFFSTAKGIVLVAPSGDGAPRADGRPFAGIPPTDERISLDPDGSLWVPGKSLCRVDLGVWKDYDLPFDVLVRRVVANGRRGVFEGTHALPGVAAAGRRTLFQGAQAGDERPVLPFRENALSFDFSATAFDQPGETRYQWRLFGFDEDWSEWSERASKEYTNLPGGDYVFRVRARNVFGKLGREASFKLRVLSPWYFTWWAWALWIVLGAGFLYGIVRFFTARLRRQKARLEELVAERTRQLREASLTDPLTGLRNRRFISEVLGNDIAAFVGLKKHVLRGKDSRASNGDDVVFGLFMLDVDHFKRVNDEHGHEAGDRVLRQLAHVLRSSVRQDDVVLRFGGEEFLVVLKKTRPEYVPAYAQKVLDRVAATSFDLGEGTVLHKTCSIGFVRFPFRSEEPDRLTFEQTLMIADLALYAAKRQGRNRGVCLEAGGRKPPDDEALMKALASLEVALDEGYLQVGPVTLGREPG